MKRNTLLKIINNKYPKLHAKPSEDFDGRPDGIWCSGEDGTQAADGFALFDYYAEDFKEVRYIFGVHKEIRDLLDQHGYYAEWHDAGTLIISEN